jgi:DNA modification methylase
LSKTKPVGNIVLGDSRNLSNYPEQIHLTITSPPYYVGKKYEKDYTFDGYRDMLKQVFHNVAMSTVRGGKIAINIADIAAFKRVSGRVEENDQVLPELTQQLKEDDCHLLARYIWHKDDPWANSQHVGYHDKIPATYVRALPNWEYIWVYYKGDSPKRADVPPVVDCFSKEDWAKWVSAVWKIDSVHANDFHEAMFPEELVRRLILLYSVPGDVVFDPFMGCYDDQTEVLTHDGWKFFSDLTFGDELLTRTLGGFLEYHKPLVLQQYKYKGEMLRIRSRSTDLLVTPNHNMYVSTHADFCAGREPRFVKVQDLDMQLYRIPCGGKFEPTIVIPREIMYLIGLYVSEGYFQKERKKYSNNLVVCQNQGTKWDEMLRNLSGLDVRKKGNRRFYVHLSGFWADFIKENCGSSKYHKFLSPTILNATHIDALFDAMVLGDGNVQKSGHVTYYTSSKKLKDSFQELCVKLDYDSTVCNRKNKVRRSVIRGQQACSTCQNYEISVRRSRSKKLLPKKHIFSENYEGHVYCATVPNHTMYVRRNGKTSWCGNSGTTAVVAYKNGRDYAGIERDEKYYELIKKSLASVENCLERQFVPAKRFKQNRVF